MADTLTALEQLEAFVSDLTHIISYKWVSRKFSISANAAKRLLHEFVDKHGNGLEVVYVVSGWMQTEPSSYSVQLVKSTQLEDTKALYAEAPSVHVYSVQASIPNDPAQLWTTDNLQSEELFNQPPEVMNSLRDNRFSGVSCSLVARECNVKTVNVPSATEQLKPASTKAPQEQQRQAETKQDTSTKAVKPPQATAKRSLTNLWGNNAKTSPPKPASGNPPPVHGNADAGINAAEEQEIEEDSEDDLANFSRLRCGGNKKRLVLDDELSEGDDVKPESGVKPDVKLHSDEEEVSPQKIDSINEADNKKKRKVLKTRIDERGREVTEVCWETEGGNKQEAPEVIQKPEPPKQAANPAPKQAPKASTSKVNGKHPAKSGKGAKSGGPQQGSITAFFKKK